jgi:predicted HAD superfamily Cof-like phosphohydrolase
MEGQFDALIDLVYFALGRAYLHGFPFAEGWKRVHSKNMEKRRANPDAPNEGKRGSKLDIVKPEGWTPPILTDLVRPQSQPATP